jgi:hypothetical protein
MAKRGRPENLGRLLDADTRARLDAGEHDAVATELAAADRHAEAGWVREQIWDFAGATEHYLVAGRLLDGIRTALEAGDPRSWTAAFEALTARRDDTPLLDEVAQLLARRGRHEDAARVLELAEAGPEPRARMLAKAGDRLAAAELLAQAGLPRQALEILGPLDTMATLASHDSPQRVALALAASHPREHALAAALCWDLGDAEGTARHAQRARRAGAFDGEIWPGSWCSRRSTASGPSRHPARSLPTVATA